MKINSETYKYLKGLSFSSGIKFTFSSKENHITDRISLIKQITHQSKLVHVGCADHIGLIDKKRIKNTWMHDILLKNTNKCIGIDLNAESIEYLRNELKIPDVFCADITKDTIPEIENENWDFIFLGEMLEHVNDPVMFLKSVKKKFSGIINKIIISVPNGFCYDNFFNTFKHFELINSDHKYWFSPYTISKVLAEADMEAEEIFLCQISKFKNRRFNLKNQLKRFLLNRYPG
ncbi:MAG: class I SAM-dependent methyltransferase, partial [Candidatus Delongbacteria bacterium]|nr:class I SAM-dependent methyltransferase [Candidatus Delongbacteria bacterium]MCG2759787.1 class I SAM-dependent methyltransferase [Candidatus Delongbacteria bacterium]